MNILAACGGRRFLLAAGCGFITSLLCYLGKIDGSIYATVVIATVGAYIAGNVYQKKVENESA